MAKRSRSKRHPEEEPEDDTTQPEEEPEEEPKPSEEGGALPPELMAFLRKAKEGDVQTGTLMQVSEERKKTFECHLPSKGIPYGDAYPDGIIHLHPITAEDEDILLSQGSLNKNMDRLLKFLIAKPQKIEPQDFTASDRLWMLIALRAASVGVEYTVKNVCDSCGANFESVIDISEELDFVPLTGVDGDPHEPYTVQLPSAPNDPTPGDTISFRLLRGRDEEEITRSVERIQNKRPGRGDPTSRYRIATVITEINGEEVTDFNERLKYVNQLQLGVKQALLSAMRKVGGDIDMEVNMKCTACGTVLTKDMPFTTEFLFPTW